MTAFFCGALCFLGKGLVYAVVLHLTCCVVGETDIASSATMAPTHPPTPPIVPPAAVSLTVAKLKLMIEKLLRVKAGQQALLLVPPPAAVGAGKGEGASSAAAAAAQEPEDITDEDSRELRYFSPSDGTRWALAPCTATRS